MQSIQEFCVMLDCSRNAVMRMPALRAYAALLAKMGYTSLMLYTEDTYEIEGEPLFGYLRGRYTADELRAFDAYCASLGLALIPCIQTLAHLNCIFKWDAPYREIQDCDDILLADDARTYALIDRMFTAVRASFTDRRIHIGMDEAHRAGLGKHLEQHGYEKRFDLICRHLHRVCALAEKHGLQPMVWDDMFCSLAREKGISSAEALRQADLPKNIVLVHWDYRTKDAGENAEKLRLAQSFGREVWHAGGAWAWKGFAPANGYSMEVTAGALAACADCGVSSLMMTVWGDDGAECSRFAVLPTLLYAVETAKGSSLAAIKEKFAEITGASFDSFLLLDAMNAPGKAHLHPRDEYRNAAAKYLLYNDPFLGLNDYRCSEADGRHYAALARSLREAPGKGTYDFVFETLACLCDVLSEKSDLGVRTRAAYQAGDRAALLLLAEGAYVRTLEHLHAFHAAFEKQWLYENKPHGFEVQDIRIGGVIQRVASCRERLLQYAEGALDSIPELEETLLEAPCEAQWSRCVSPNVIAHLL